MRMRSKGEGEHRLLTLSECVSALGKTVSRSTLERAVQSGELPAQPGFNRQNKPCAVVEHAALVRWHQERADVLRWLAQQPLAADDDDAALADDEGRAADEASADDATALQGGVQERLSATLRDVQSAAIAEVGRQLEPLLDRISAISERAGRLEAENAALRAQLEEARQRARPAKGRGLLRRMWGG